MNERNGVKHLMPYPHHLEEIEKGKKKTKKQNQISNPHPYTTRQYKIHIIILRFFFSPFSSSRIVKWKRLDIQM